jgi:type I restriction enzyme M protein
VALALSGGKRVIPLRKGKKEGNVSSSAIVQKLWNYCNVLRDDGMSYGDYVEQLTYLLFLKMADERTRPPYNQKSPVPEKYNWQSLLKKDGDELFDHYRHILEKLANEKGLLGLIFNKSQNKFQDPVKRIIGVSE